MRDKAGVDQKVSDAGLIAWFCQMQEETEAHGEWNDATKFGTQVFTGLERVKVRGGGARKRSTKLGESVAYKSRKLRSRENELPKSLAASPAAIVETTNGKISKFRARVFVGLEHMKVLLRQAQNRLAKLGGSIASKQRPQKELRARENELRKSLTSALDAIVVTNSARRFVAANPKALELFGISETNMKMFTIDAFLSCSQIPYFDENGAPFISRKEKHGACEITSGRKPASRRIYFCPKLRPFSAFMQVP